MNKFWYVFDSSCRTTSKYKSYEEAKKVEKYYAEMNLDNEVYVLEAKCMFKCQTVTSCEEVEEKDNV